MLNEFFVFDGVSSHDVGIQLQSSVTLSAAEPSVEKTTVPGRNGDIVYFDGSFGNRTVTANCFVLGAITHDALTAISKWCAKNAGYRKFEYSEWPEYYMMARAIATPDISARIRLVAPFALEFDCKPQRYLKSGDIPIDLTEPGALYNSGMPANPIITVNGSGAGVITVGDTSVTLNDIDEYLVLDCETQNAYKGAENKNATIYALEFPTLPQGKTLITWSGGISSISVVPRWWTL